MRAMILDKPRQPLTLQTVADPIVAPGRVVARVRACAVCRTDLHVLDGELPKPKLPLILGHEIVGEVVSVGKGSERWAVGDRIGIPWLGWTCGECGFCTSNRENLCERALFTGYTLDGGYAEMVAADERFCFAIPTEYSDVEAAPLLCAGMIGYRSLSMTGDAQRLGIYGFGAAAHIVTQVAKCEGREVYAFTRQGDAPAQKLARASGAIWAGGSDEKPPVELDAAIVFAPVGDLVPQALKGLAKGGTVVCGGIHMSDIPSFPYELLWHERTIRSVANLTRADGEKFLKTAPMAGVRVQTETFPFTEANRALHLLRRGALKGVAVLTV